MLPCGIITFIASSVCRSFVVQLVFPLTFSFHKKCHWGLKILLHKHYILDTIRKMLTLPSIVLQKPYKLMCQYARMVPYQQHRIHFSFTYFFVLKKKKKSDDEMIILAKIRQQLETNVDSLIVLRL